MKQLLIIDYLKNGGTFESLLTEHGVHAKPYNGKISFIYDQITAKDANPLANQCRGLILRENTFEVVAYPFDRFFNMGQGEAADIDWDTAVCEEKLDGSLVIVYRDDVDNVWRCATRSMCEAQGILNDASITFAQLVDECARQYGYKSLNDWMRKVCAKPIYTYMFELTGPHNQIVCEYKELNMTLLGVRRFDFQEVNPDMVAKWHGFRRPRTWSFSTMDDLIKIIKEWSPKDYEGVVVVDNKFNRIKIKSPQYVAAHKASSALGASWRNVCETILTGHADDLIPLVPPLVQDRIATLRVFLEIIMCQVDKDYAELKNISDMKEFALRAQQRLWPAPLFALKRGKVDSLSEFMSNANTIGVLEICKKVGWSET